MGAILSQNASVIIVYSTVYSDADQRKYQSSASQAFVRGIHRCSVNSPHRWPASRKMVPFDVAIMKRIQVETQKVIEFCNYLLISMCYQILSYQKIKNGFAQQTVSRTLETVSSVHMMTSSNGNIFHVTGPLCGEFTGHRWIPLTKGQWRGTLVFSLICAWINGWVNNREANGLRRHLTHYHVIVMTLHNFAVITNRSEKRCQMIDSIWLAHLRSYTIDCLEVNSTMHAHRELQPRMRWFSAQIWLCIYQTRSA